MSKTNAFYESAMYYNRKNAVALPEFTPSDPGSREFVDVVVVFQTAHGLKVDGKCGPMTTTRFRQELLDGGEVRVLTRQRLIEIATVVSQFEGKFWSLNRDGEYRGLFDKPHRDKPYYHWASENNPDKEHGTHIGLSFGYIQFTQDGGKLGVLLERMYEADPGLFTSVFGEHWRELIDRCTATGKSRKLSNIGGDGLRSPRVWPVASKDLWEGSYWPDRFKEAGRHKVFQDCQVSIAVDDYMIPGMRHCEDLGLMSERAVAMVFDRCVQYGPGGARRKLLDQKPRRNDEGEHFWLKRLEDYWEKYSWHHRTQKLWEAPEFYDGPCSWEDLT